MVIWASPFPLICPRGLYMAPKFRHDCLVNGVYQSLTSSCHFKKGGLTTNDPQKTKKYITLSNEIVFFVTHVHMQPVAALNRTSLIFSMSFFDKGQYLIKNRPSIYYINTWIGVFICIIWNHSNVLVVDVKVLHQIRPMMIKGITDPDRITFSEGPFLFMVSDQKNLYRGR